jgi:hypothetical protein
MRGCTGRWGLCRHPKHFLRLIVFHFGRGSSIRPSASNANRWAAENHTVYSQRKPIEIGKKDKKMKYRVHRLEVKKDTAQEKLEQFLNQLEGEVLSIVPYVTPTFQGMGATAKVDYLLIVEKVN